MAKKRYALWTAMVVCLVMTTGCSEFKKVSGTITLDGEPVEKVIVEFLPVEKGNPMGYGSTDANGYYNLKTSRKLFGVRSGVYKVSLQHASQAGGGAPIQTAPGETIQQVQKIVIPQRYYGQGSELEVEVTGNSKFDFDLTSAPE